MIHSCLKHGEWITIALFFYFYYCWRIQMKKVIVLVCGWSGCAAAISARKAGAEAIVLERTDMLLGTGLVGGIMRNNGRHTATEEMIAMGGGDLFEICD